MNTNTYFNYKVARKVVEYVVFLIVWVGIFPIVVVSGIYTKLTQNKVDANTRITSEESKIPPKNTNTQSSNFVKDVGEEFNQFNREYNEFGYPDRSVKK